MHILGIESSCDDTSVALLSCNKKKIQVLAQKTASQIDIHKKYGGVVPEIAGRKHAEYILPTIEAVLEGQKKPDAIAVTSGPGLVTGLLVGIEAAKTLSYVWNIPLVSVNHIEGHMHSVLLPDDNGDSQSIEFPAIALVVSGGHTELILIKKFGDYELLGKTRDDAAGECFDKVGKLLDFDYPGGPKISKLATKGDNKAIPFPRPMLEDTSFDFSFSGLKTAALYWLRDNPLSPMPTHPFSHIATWLGMKKEAITRADFCASFEEAIVDVLVRKTTRAVQTYKPKTLLLAGGVSANPTLRTRLQQIPQVSVILPPKQYTMDNAAMIAVAGYVKAQKNEYTSWKDIQPNPSWKVYE